MECDGSEAEERSRFLRRARGRKSHAARPRPRLVESEPGCQKRVRQRSEESSRRHQRRELIARSLRWRGYELTMENEPGLARRGLQPAYNFFQRRTALSLTDHGRLQPVDGRGKMSAVVFALGQC